MSNPAQNTINAKINISIAYLVFFVGCSINAHVKHSKLLFGRSTTMHLDSLDVVTLEFCSIPIKQDLFQTKLNVLQLLSGKI